MGMFDEVVVPEIRCPGCGGDLDFQTKDYTNTLDKVTVPQVMAALRLEDDDHASMNMLGDCRACRLDVEVRISADRSLTTEEMLARLKARMGR